MRKANGTDIFVALAVGVGVGALVGLLLAPQSGEETIDYLRKGASEKLDGAMRAGRNLTRRAQDGVNVAKEYVSDAAEAGKKQASRAQDQVQSRVEQLKDTAQNRVDQLKDNAQQIADAGQRAYREAANS